MAEIRSKTSAASNKGGFPRNVDALGVDVGAMAAAVRAQIAAAAARPKVAHDHLRVAYERSQARSQRREREPIRPRVEQLTRIRDLLSLAKGRTVAAHFQKLEQANDEELAELATALRELCEDDEGHSDKSN